MFAEMTRRIASWPGPHLLHVHALTKVCYEAAQEGHEVFRSSDVSWHLLHRSVHLGENI